MIYGTLFRDWALHGGDGYLGGNPPSGDDDGRAKILNEPKRVLVQVYTMHDAAHLVYVGSVLSGHDGTWRLSGIDRSKRYRVIGVDLAGSVNSAIQDWIVPAQLGT
ncbi:hypothetical protein [Stenotrophomonas maltophilia]|uniref:hypothetical protein n=1 Tax=Stenotrophomonas maltophilia TaxID=40324 RepID=UPI0039F6BA1B